MTPPHDGELAERVKRSPSQRSSFDHSSDAGVAVTPSPNPGGAVSSPRAYPSRSRAHLFMAHRQRSWHVNQRPPPERQGEQGNASCRNSNYDLGNENSETVRQKIARFQQLGLQHTPSARRCRSVSTTGSGTALASLELSAKLMGAAQRVESSIEENDRIDHAHPGTTQSHGSADTNVLKTAIVDSSLDESMKSDHDNDVAAAVFTSPEQNTTHPLRRHPPRDATVSAGNTISGEMSSMDGIEASNASRKNLQSTENDAATKREHHNFRIQTEKDHGTLLEDHGIIPDTINDRIDSGQSSNSLTDDGTVEQATNRNVNDAHFSFSQRYPGRFMDESVRANRMLDLQASENSSAKSNNGADSKTNLGLVSTKMNSNKLVDSPDVSASATRTLDSKPPSSFHNDDVGNDGLMLKADINESVTSINGREDSRCHSLCDEELNESMISTNSPEEPGEPISIHEGACSNDDGSEGVHARILSSNGGFRDEAIAESTGDSTREYFDVEVATPIRGRAGDSLGSPNIGPEGLHLDNVRESVEDFDTALKTVQAAKFADPVDISDDINSVESPRHVPGTEDELLSNSMRIETLLQTPAKSNTTNSRAAGSNLGIPQRLARTPLKPPAQTRFADASNGPLHESIKRLQLAPCQDRENVFGGDEGLVLDEKKDDQSLQLADDDSKSFSTDPTLQPLPSRRDEGRNKAMVLRDRKKRKNTSRNSKTGEVSTVQVRRPSQIAGDVDPSYPVGRVVSRAFDQMAGYSSQMRGFQDDNYGYDDITVDNTVDDAGYSSDESETLISEVHNAFLTTFGCSVAPPNKFLNVLNDDDSVNSEVGSRTTSMQDSKTASTTSAFSRSQSHQAMRHVRTDSHASDSLVSAAYSEQSFAPSHDKTDGSVQDDTTEEQSDFSLRTPYFTKVDHPFSFKIPDSFDAEPPVVPKSHANSSRQSHEHVSMKSKPSLYSPDQCMDFVAIDDEGVNLLEEADGFFTRVSSLKVVNLLSSIQNLLGTNSVMDEDEKSMVLQKIESSIEKRAKGSILENEREQSKSLGMVETVNTNTDEGIQRANWEPGKPDGNDEILIQTAQPDQSTRRLSENAEKNSNVGDSNQHGGSDQIEIYSAINDVSDIHVVAFPDEEEGLEKLCSENLAEADLDQNDSTQSNSYEDLTKKLSNINLSDNSFPPYQEEFEQVLEAIDNVLQEFDEQDRASTKVAKRSTADKFVADDVTLIETRRPLESEYSCHGTEAVLGKAQPCEEESISSSADLMVTMMVAMQSLEIELEATDKFKLMAKKSSEEESIATQSSTKKSISRHFEEEAIDFESELVLARKLFTEESFDEEKDLKEGGSIESMRASDLNHYSQVDESASSRGSDVANSDICLSSARDLKRRSCESSAGSTEVVSDQHMNFGCAGNEIHKGETSKPTYEHQEISRKTSFNSSTCSDNLKGASLNYSTEDGLHAVIEPLNAFERIKSEEVINSSRKKKKNFGIFSGLLRPFAMRKGSRQEDGGVFERRSSKVFGSLSRSAEDPTGHFHLKHRRAKAMKSKNSRPLSTRISNTTKDMSTSASWYPQECDNGRNTIEDHLPSGSLQTELVSASTNSDQNVSNSGITLNSPNYANELDGTSLAFGTDFTADDDEFDGWQTFDSRISAFESNHFKTTEQAPKTFLTPLRPPPRASFATPRISNLQRRNMAISVHEPKSESSSSAPCNLFANEENARKEDIELLQFDDLNPAPHSEFFSPSVFPKGHILPDAINCGNNGISSIIADPNTGNWEAILDISDASKENSFKTPERRPLHSAEAIECIPQSGFVQDDKLNVGSSVGIASAIYAAPTSANWDDIVDLSGESKAGTFMTPHRQSLHSAEAIRDIPQSTLFQRETVHDKPTIGSSAGIASAIYAAPTSANWDSFGSHTESQPDQPNKILAVWTTPDRKSLQADKLTNSGTLMWESVLDHSNEGILVTGYLQGKNDQIQVDNKESPQQVSDFPDS
jgi:hypothetical protein